MTFGRYLVLTETAKKKHLPPALEPLTGVSASMENRLLIKLPAVVYYFGQFLECLVGKIVGPSGIIAFHKTT